MGTWKYHTQEVYDYFFWGGEVAVPYEDYSVSFFEFKNKPVRRM